MGYGIFVVIGFIVIVVIVAYYMNKEDKPEKTKSNSPKTDFKYNSQKTDDKLLKNLNAFFHDLDYAINISEGMKLDEDTIKEFNDSYSRYNLTPLSVPFSEIIQSDIICLFFGIRQETLNQNMKKGINILDYFNNYFCSDAIERAKKYLSNNINDSKNDVIGGKRFDITPNVFYFLIDYSYEIDELNKGKADVESLGFIPDYFLKYTEALLHYFLNYGVITATEEESNIGETYIQKFNEIYENVFHKNTNHNQNIKIQNNAPNNNEDLDTLLEELNSLIGLEKVKEEVNNLINLVKVRKMREEQGLKQVPLSLHLVFSGNPGTGKTTVARILSKIYKELGVLSKGQLVETDRAGLVAGYVGQTAIQTTEVINKAKGGILFIDEAYSLTSYDDSSDFGKEAVDTILKAMEDMRDDFIVIVAGYPDLMKQFLKSNPGLESRFNTFIDFEDYKPTELFKIFELMCEKNNYILPESLYDYVETQFNTIYKNRDDSYANARTVRNFFENAVKQQANRVTKLVNTSREELQTFTLQDLM